MTLSAQRNQLRSKKDESEAVPVVRLKHAVRLVVDKVDSVSPGTRYVGLENIESWSGRWLNSDQPVDIEGGATRFHAGDVLFGKLRPYLAKSLRTDGSGVCTSELLVLRPHRLDQRYLHWVTLSPHFIEAVNATTFGAKMPRASWDNIGVLPVPVPPREDQRRIADFLDRKTAEIDALIAKKERMIALLNEKRQAVLMHGVTCGVGAPLSTVPTGSQWLRTMPSHWQGLPLKRLVATPITDGPHETPALVAEGVPFLSAEAVSNGQLDFALMRGFISLDDHRLFCRKCKPRRDDVLLCKSGATTGKVAIVITDEEFSVWSPLALIRAHPKKLLPRFIYHAITSRYVQTQIQNLWSVGTQPNIGMNVIERLWIAVPPIEEQAAIARWIDSSLNESDDMVAHLARSMSLLREYRQALISEAVAGRIGVGISDGATSSHAKESVPC